MAATGEQLHLGTAVRYMYMYMNRNQGSRAEGQGSIRITRFTRFTRFGGYRQDGVMAREASQARQGGHDLHGKWRERR